MYCTYNMDTICLDQEERTMEPTMDEHFPTRGVPPPLHPQASSATSPLIPHIPHAFSAFSLPHSTCPSTTTTHTQPAIPRQYSPDAPDNDLNSLCSLVQRSRFIMADQDGHQHPWAFYIVLTALLLSLLVASQILTTYVTAYLAAPGEITTYIDALDFSSLENESYDRDLNKVQRVDERHRLHRLLLEIQKCTDDLRHRINRLTLTNRKGDRVAVRWRSRLMWASKRPRLEERVRRLDLLRMRFLVVYMGTVANQAQPIAIPSEKTFLSPIPMSPPVIPLPPTPPTPPALPTNLLPSPPVTPKPPPLPVGLTDAIMKKPTLRKISTTPVKRKDNNPPKPEHMGWAGVIAELQKSPLLHKRHQSIETAMAAETAMATATAATKTLSSPPSSAYP